MRGDTTILVISDRPDRSENLAQQLRGTHPCQVVGLYEDNATAGEIAAVVTDVCLRDPSDLERLKRLVTPPRESGAPVVAILRSDNYLERVQASAIGATSLITPNASFVEILMALGPAIWPANSSEKPVKNPEPAKAVDQARISFQTIFDATTRAEYINKGEVDNATDAVIAAVSESGIRQWLEVVWTYDDATYQHCLLVTGLAAEFAFCLRCSANDQRRLTRGALLHDIGKAKIPLAILNKPRALTSEEIAIMRTHPLIGYEILREQGGYEIELLEVVLRHHELLDGSGYPDGLVGAQIHDLVRLVTICDIYAALIERRPYKETIEPSQAFKMLEKMEGKLEGALVRAFASVAEKSAAPDLAKWLYQVRHRLRDDDISAA